MSNDIKIDLKKTHQQATTIVHFHLFSDATHPCGMNYNISVRVCSLLTEKNLDEILAESPFLNPKNWLQHTNVRRTMCNLYEACDYMVLREDFTDWLLENAEDKIAVRASFAPSLCESLCTRRHTTLS